MQKMVRTFQRVFKEYFFFQSFFRYDYHLQATNVFYKTNLFVFGGFEQKQRAAV